MDESSGVSIADPQVEATSDPAETYWAKQPVEELLGTLEDKTKKYVKAIKSGVYWNRVLRSLSYNHGLYYDGSASSIALDVKQTGEQGEFLGVAANHFRNLLQHLHSMVTRDKLALTCRAVNTDNKSIERAKMGRGLVDYYQREKGMSKKLRLTCEYALNFGHAFFVALWDQAKKTWDDDENTTSGDISFYSLPPSDVAYDLAYTDFTDSPWIAFKSNVNRFDLAMTYPEHGEDILNSQEPEELRLKVYDSMRAIDPVKGDTIPLWRFFHKKTPAIPTGRYCEWVPGTYLKDEVLLYREPPIRRMAAGEWLLSSFGMSPAFDLQGLQEMFNVCLSAISSAVAAFGVQNVWAPPGNEKIVSILMKNGLRVLVCPQKPEGLNTLAVPSELWKFLDVLIAQMERISGVNSVVRGDPDPSLKSGEALKVIEARAYQFSGPLQESYNTLNEEAGTDLIRILQDFAEGTRTVNILGRSNRSYQKTFEPDDLESIDRVVVELTNPLAKGTAGKLSMAQDLMKLGELRTKEQYIEVLQTGNMDVLFEADNAQFNLIREENEALGEGKVIPEPAPTDNHLLHMKEHAGANLGTIENRAGPIRINTEAHLQLHMQMLLNPTIQQIQIALGYQVPAAFLVPPGMPAMPQAGGPQPGQGPQEAPGQVVNMPKMNGPEKQAG